MTAAGRLAQALRAGDRLLARHFAQRVARGTGLTLIQGDAQLGNALLPRDPGQHRPVLIDWKGCIRGMGRGNSG
jgi:hypothetical protein